ncbi:MAG: carbon storage regulator [Planctomycetota bacterium]
MLVLTRKRGEEIVIDGCIRIRVLDVKGNKVRLGIDAPGSMSVLRRELLPGPKPFDPGTEGEDVPGETSPLPPAPRTLAN